MVYEGTCETCSNNGMLIGKENEIVESALYFIFIFFH